MLEKTEKEFISEAENLLKAAATDTDYVKIKTGMGNAVLISEAEWNILLEALKLAVHTAK